MRARRQPAGRELVGAGYTQEGATDPLFAALSVAQEDRVVHIGAFDGDVAAALGSGSSLSLPYLIDVVVPPLAQATDGDPATGVEQPTV